MLRPHGSMISAWEKPPSIKTELLWSWEAKTNEKFAQHLAERNVISL